MKKFQGSPETLGTAKKACLCRSCGNTFSSQTSFVLHQEYHYDTSEPVRCITDPDELASRNIVMGRRGRYTIDPDSNWWESIKEANTKFDGEDEEE